ncbi:MAG: ABC transporter permease subunit [Candidatus Margulisiibacteriota bacterium]
MSYYTKKRIRDYLIHFIMLAFLVITLFPIGWMVFTSLKENNDILVGKIPFGTAHNDCMKMELTPTHLWVMSSDGGINKIDRKDFKIEAYESERTSSTSFVTDKDYVWVGSANRVLTRVEKNNLKEHEDFDLPLGPFDQAKVVATSVIRDIKNDRLWYTMQYRGYEGLIEFDTKDLKVVKAYDLANRFSPFQIKCIARVGEYIWVGTDKRLFKFSPGTGEMKNNYDIAAYLPQGPVQMDPMGDKLILSGMTGAHIFDTEKGVVTRTLLKDRAQTVLPAKDAIYVGTNVGYERFPLAGNGVTRVENLFFSVNARGDIEKDNGYVPAEVSAMAVDGPTVFAGSSYGRITKYNAALGRVENSAEAHKGHRVVSWVNYVDMWHNVDFGLYLRNSFFICLLSMIFSMVFATMAAYAISRFDFPGNRTFSMTILLTQMVPYLMFLIPIYSMYVKFYEITGIPLKGTFFGIIFMYSIFFIPFSIWILRGFFAAIPYELEEAARIDGCSPWQVFWHIVLPLAVPGIIATGVYVFLTAWDELLFAWVLTSADTMTIPVGIRNFVGNYQNRFDLIMAASTVATLPVMVLFFMLQRYIVKGLTAGAVKG